MKYECSSCGRGGVRLWRTAHVFLDRVELFCLPCALDSGGLKYSDSSVPGTLKERLDSGSLGDYVAARPTPDGSFWGHTSGPQESVDAWRALPFGRAMMEGRCTSATTA